MTRVEEYPINIGTKCIFHKEGEDTAFLCEVIAHPKHLVDSQFHYSIKRIDGKIESDVLRYQLRPTDANSLKNMARDFILAIGADTQIRKRLEENDVSLDLRFELAGPQAIIFRPVRSQDACWVVESDGETLATTTESDFDLAIAELESLLTHI